MHKQDTLVIRPATASDTDNLAVLSIHVWLDTYAVQGIRRDYSQFVLAEFTPQAYEHMLDDPHTTILVYEHDDILQGFAVLKDATQCPNHTATIELTKLYVHAKWQGQGIGKALLEKTKAKASLEGYVELSLIVFADNTRAITLYEHSGFNRVKNIELEPHHLIPHEGGCILMKCAL